MKKTDSLENTLMLGKTEGRRRREWDGWIALLTQWTWVWISSGSWWWTGKPGMLQSMRSNELDMTEQLNLTDILIYCIKSIILLLVFCLFHLCYVPFSLFSCLHWDNFFLVILLCLIFYSIWSWRLHVHINLLKSNITYHFQNMWGN